MNDRALNTLGVAKMWCARIWCAKKGPAYAGQSGTNWQLGQMKIQGHILEERLQLPSSSFEIIIIAIFHPEQLCMVACVGILSGSQLCLHTCRRCSIPHIPCHLLYTLTLLYEGLC